MEIKLWREILAPYDLAVKELTVKFEHLIEEYHSRGEYSPIERVAGRVKTIDSILNKAQKKGIPLDEIEERISDIAGIRIVCQFVEDIQQVIAHIQRRTDMEIINQRDYISHSKDSGYRSYHLIVRYEVQTENGPKKINVEIQIRTLAMNFWSTIEHSLQYKYQGNIPEYISEKLANVSEATTTLDNEMASVRSDMLDAENTKIMHENLVNDILKNIQNLYKMTNFRDIEKIQDEFYRVYEQDDLESLREFSSKLDMLAEGYHVQTID